MSQNAAIPPPALLPEEVLFEEVDEECLAVTSLCEPEPPYTYEDRNHAFYLYLQGKTVEAFKILKRVTYKEIQYLFNIINFQNNIRLIRSLVQMLLDSADVVTIFERNDFKPITENIEEDNKILHKSAHLYAKMLYEADRKEDAMILFKKLGEPASCYITARLLASKDDDESLADLYEYTKVQFFLVMQAQVLYRKGEKDAAFLLFDQLDQQQTLMLVNRFLFENKDENGAKYREKMQTFKNSKQQPTNTINENLLKPFARCQAVVYGLMLYEENKKSESMDYFRRIDDVQSILMIGHHLLNKGDDSSLDIIKEIELYDAFKYCAALENGDFDAFQDMYENLQNEIPLLICSMYLVDIKSIKNANTIASKLDPFGSQYIEGDQSTSNFARYLYEKGYFDDAMKYWCNGKYPSRGISFLLAKNDQQRVIDLVNNSWPEEYPVCGIKCYQRGMYEFAIEIFKSCYSDFQINTVSSFLLRKRDFMNIRALYDRSGNEFYLVKLGQNYYDSNLIGDAYEIFDSLLNENSIFLAAQFLLNKGKVDDSILLIKKTTDQKKIEQFCEQLYRKDQRRQCLWLFHLLDDDEALFLAARFLLLQNNFEKSRYVFQAIRDPKYLFDYGKELFKHQMDEIGYEVYRHLESDRFLNKAAKEMYPIDQEKSLLLFNKIKEDKFKVRYGKLLYENSKILESMKIFQSIKEDKEVDLIVWYLCTKNDYVNLEKIVAHMKYFDGPGLARYAVTLYDLIPEGSNEDNDGKNKAKAIKLFKNIQKHEYLYVNKIRPVNFLIQKGEFNVAQILYSRMTNSAEIANYLIELCKNNKREEAMKLFNEAHSTNQEITKLIADYLSEINDAENYDSFRDKITEDKFLFQHGMILFNQKKKDNAIVVFRKIKAKEFGCKATTILYANRINDVADEFNEKFPSGQRLFTSGKGNYSRREYIKAWECFQKIDEQEFILNAAVYLFEKNEFDKAVTLFKRYDGDIEPMLCFKLAKEFHKKEMFEEAHFYYKKSNCSQARAVLSRCFRDHTVGAYKKPSSIQQILFKEKENSEEFYLDENDDSQNSNNSNNNNNNTNNEPQIDPLELEELEKKMKKEKSMKRIETVVSGASETYNALSIIYSFLPAILGLVRLIQSCSITVSKSSVGFVEKFQELFEWSTKLLNKIAFDWVKIDAISNDQSLLIYTFLCTFLLSMFSIGFNNGYKAILACFVNSILFIPIGIGLDYLPEKLGIGLFCGFVVLYIILASVVMTKVKNTIPRYLLCYYLPQSVNEKKIITWQDKEKNKHFGWFSDNNYISRHAYWNINLCLLIPIAVFILISYGILKTNTLFYVVIICCAIVYIIGLGLQIVFKQRIYTFMQIIGTGLGYFSMIVGQIMLLPFMEMLANADNPTPPKTIIIFVVAFSIFIPYINIIVSCVHVFKMRKSQHPLFVRSWLMCSFSSASSLCSELRLNAWFWPILDFGYHILYAISNAFVDPIMNLVLACISIILTLVFRPYYLVSQNVLYISEPVVLVILNSLIIHNKSKTPIEISIGYVILAIAIIPVVFALLFYWIYEKQREHEFFLMMQEINDPGAFCCCSSYSDRYNVIANDDPISDPFTTEEINKKVFSTKRNKLYHELFRSEQNRAEALDTNTYSPECIPDVGITEKIFDPITLGFGDTINKIVLGPGMIFTAAAICHMIRSS